MQVESNDQFPLKIKPFPTDNTGKGYKKINKFFSLRRHYPDQVQPV